MHTIFHRKTPPTAVSLIEVLIVIAIIAALVQLTLPAVQMARESARKSQCSNNLRQIGLAIQLHETSHGHYPTGGWGYLNVGDPDRGAGSQQPGGWIYNTLPFLGYQDLHAIGLGLSGEAKFESATKMCGTSLSIFGCSSRREPGRSWPFEEKNYIYGNYNPPEAVGKTDYAGNGGEMFDKGEGSFSGPPRNQESDYTNWLDTSKASGIFFQRSTVGNRDVLDGLSKTYFVGEKYIQNNQLESNVRRAIGDDQSMYIGVDYDTIRWAANPSRGVLSPRRDESTFKENESFGSAHFGGCYFAFGDGSVRLVSYGIDENVYRYMANRKDAGVGSE